MQYYYAPLEGITDDLFRRVHNRHFPGTDRYYTPFLSPCSDGPALTRKELRQVLPENNEGIPLIPQLISNSAPAFLRAAALLRDLGYKEVNLNLGCPSGTVCAKNKGAGALKDREQLRKFLDEIFDFCPLEISLKTRLGWADPGEFEALLALYNQYPVKALIIHPRVREDFYRKPVHMDAFRAAREISRPPLVLSGGIGKASDLPRRFPGNESMPEAIMLGRGLVANPGLIRQIKSGRAMTREEFQEFHRELFSLTAERLGNARGTMFRMKELWGWMILMFDGREKYQKQLRKATTLTEYEAVTLRIFRELPLRQEADMGLDYLS